MAFLKVMLIAILSIVTAQLYDYEIFSNDPSKFTTMNPDYDIFVTNENVQFSNIADDNEINCACLPRKNCNMPSDGSGLFDVRKSECFDNNEFCCPFTNMINETTTKSPRKSLIGKKCGVRHTNGINTRIQTDEDSEAELGEFPWIVSIFSTKNVPQIEFACGGSLIHPEVVVTVAHCMKGGKKFTHTWFVRAGDHDQQSELETVAHQDRGVDQIKKHPQYYQGGLFNDIALLFLKSPFDLKSHINLICIPNKTTNFDNQQCFAGGWGKDSEGPEGVSNNLLQKVELPVVPKMKCQKQLKDTGELPDSFTLHESFICAGGIKNKDTCKGDGGSPLVCAIPSDPLHYYQAGIVSWGIGCGKEDVPAVYTNVALFRDWIDGELKLKKLDTSVYHYT